MNPINFSKLSKIAEIYANVNNTLKGTDFLPGKFKRSDFFHLHVLRIEKHKHIFNKSSYRVDNLNKDGRETNYTDLSVHLPFSKKSILSRVFLFLVCCIFLIKGTVIICSVSGSGHQAVRDSSGQH